MLRRFRLLLMREMMSPLMGSSSSDHKVSCGESVTMVPRNRITAIGSRNTISMEYITEYSSTCISLVMRESKLPLRSSLW